MHLFLYNIPEWSKFLQACVPFVKTKVKNAISMHALAAGVTHIKET